MSAPVWVTVQVQVMRDGRLSPKHTLPPFALPPEFGGTDLGPLKAGAQVADIVGVEHYPVGSVIEVGMKVDTPLGVAAEWITLHPPGESGG